MAEQLFFIDFISVLYAGKTVRVEVLGELTVLNLCQALELDFNKSLDAEFLYLTNDIGKKINFSGTGFSAFISGKHFKKNSVYTLTTNPVDISATDTNTKNTFIIHINHMRKTIDLDLTGNFALLKFSLAYEFSISDDFFDLLGLITSHGVNIPFEANESGLDIIPCYRLIKENSYTVWAVDKREELINRLSPQELAEIRSVFDRLDADGSGEVDMDELQQFLDETFQIEEDRLNALYGDKPEELERHTKMLMADKKQQTKQFFARSQGSDCALSWHDFLLSEAFKYVNRKVITVSFGAKTREIVIKSNADLISVEIQNVLNDEQLLALDVQGLSEQKTGSFIEFLTDGNTGYKIIKNSDLQHGAVYDLLFTDTRENFVSALTEDQTKNVLDEFNMYDSRGKGYITHQEVENYYKKKLHNDRIQNESSNLSSLQLRVLLNRQKEYYASCIKSFKSLDINEDNHITFDEYLLKASQHPERYSDVSFTIYCNSKAFPMIHRYTVEIPLTILKASVGEGIYHQQFWRAMHLVKLEPGQVPSFNDFPPAVDENDQVTQSNYILFDRDPFSDEFALKISKLETNGRYELIRQDLRQVALRLMPQEEFEEAKERFLEMDQDGSGSVDVQEAQIIFHKKSQEAIARAHKQFPADSSALTAALEEAKELRFMYDSFMQSFSHGHKTDIISISFNEFVAAHAFFMCTGKMSLNPTGF